ADDLPDLFLIRVLVDKRHRCAERHGIAGKLRYVDYFRAGNLVFELGNAAFVQRLLLFSRVILRVLGEVAVAARFGDLLNDARAVHRLAVAQFGFEGGKTRSSHRDLFHGSETLGRLTKIHRSRAGFYGRRDRRTDNEHAIVLDRHSRARLLGPVSEVALQRTNLEIAAQISLDPLRRSDSTG